MKFTSKVKADLSKIIAKSDSVLRLNLSFVVKSGTVDSDALTDFKKAMRFKSEPDYSAFGHLESLMSAYALENMLVWIASTYPKEIPNDGVQTQAEAKAAAIKAF